MSTIKKTALLAVCLAVGTVTAGTAQAEYGYWGKFKGGKYQGCYDHFQKVPMGATINLKGFYGEKPGEVFLYVRGAKFHVKVIAWTPKSVKLVMPVMKLAGDWHGKNYGKLMVFGKHEFKHGYKYGYNHGGMVGCFPIELLPPVVKKAGAKGGVAPKAGAGGAVAPGGAGAAGAGGGAGAGNAGVGGAGAGAAGNTSAPAGDGAGQSLEQQLIVVETPAADGAEKADKPADVKEAKAPAGAPDDLK